jgi:hypothetical protein
VVVLMLVTIITKKIYGAQVITSGILLVT